MLKYRTKDVKCFRKNMIFKILRKIFLCCFSFSEHCFVKLSTSHELLMVPALPLAGLAVVVAVVAKELLDADEEEKLEVRITPGSPATT